MSRLIILKQFLVAKWTHWGKKCMSALLCLDKESFIVLKCAMHPPRVKSALLNPFPLPCPKLCPFRNQVFLEHMSTRTKAIISTIQPSTMYHAPSWSLEHMSTLQRCKYSSFSLQMCSTHPPKPLKHMSTPRRPEASILHPSRVHAMPSFSPLCAQHSWEAQNISFHPSNLCHTPYLD